jgi:hypothetical protein
MKTATINKIQALYYKPPIVFDDRRVIMKPLGL